ncbi:MAG TPA: hypothetical protein VJR89_13905 [Polyangiales bacterium]|nr:hypothetical protein [Polyangiales bacterium]
MEPFECTAETPVRMTEVPFTTHVREAGSPRAPKGLVVKACRASDLECSDPYKAVEDIAGNGEITLLLPWGFSGYLEFSSNGMLGLLYYMSRPVTEPIETESMSLLTPEERAATAMISRQPVDLEKTGMVLAQMHDCSGTPAPGVRFEIDKPRPRPYFVVDGEPSADADVSVFDPDRREAQGGFLNVEPGVALVRARLGLDGPILGQANLLVRPKTITQLEIFPYLQ